MRFVCDSCRAQYMISDEKVGPKGVKVRCKKCGYVILVKKADANGHGASAHTANAHATKAPPAPQAPVPLSNDPDDALATQVMNNPLGSPGATLPLPGESIDATNPGIGDEKTSQMPAQKSGFDASEDEIGAVFDQVLNSGAHSIPKGAKNDEKTELDRPAMGSEGDDRMSTRVLDAEVVKKLAEETGGEGEAPKNGNGHSEKKDIPKTDWFVAIDDKQTGPLTLDKIKEHWERGEIGPDSLCWRAGFSDWIPVSEVADLAAELAPRPAKPVVVAPVTVGGMPPGAVVSVPVESAFSAGGVMKSVRSEVQVPLAAAPAEETGSWRPSAASALASLVKEEMEALAKPPPKADVADPLGGDVPLVSSGGLLSDLPEASIAQPKPAKGVNGHSSAPAGAGEMTAAHGPKNPYIANPGATYSSPAVAQYRPQQQTNVALIAVIAFAGVAVLGIGAFVFVSLQPKHVDPPQQPVVQQPPVQQPPVQQPPAVAQPNTQQPPPANTQQPPPNETGTTQTAPPPAKPETQAANGNNPVKPTSPKPIGASSKSTEKKETVVAKAEPTEKPAKEEKAKPVANVKGGDDEFENAFGSGKPEKKESAKTEKASEESSSGSKKSSVYIPPAPGQGGNIPETLGQADVMEVVKANIGAIKKCVDEQKQKEPGSSGKLVMKWTIQTSGKATKVEVQSEEFKTSYIAGCVGGLIKQWQFPKHKTQMAEPVVFPFKF